MATGTEPAELLLKMDEAKDVDVHFFACDIKYRGKANVPAYFSHHVEPIEGEPGNFKSRLRGRPLRGRQVALPEGYSGIVARSAATESGDTKELYVSGRFEKMTAWNWSSPMTEEKYRQMNEWIAVAQALHAPCDE
uniref:Putative ribonuclease h2 non-catalytic subunit n=1 Tax=Amblyomma aureolatum TaxID=187763 RepID=A0A1E1WYR4_9ACAR